MKTNGGWRDGSMGEVLSVQAYRHGLHPQHSHTKGRCGWIDYDSGSGEGEPDLWKMLASSLAKC